MIKVRIKDLEFSKVICGTNPIYARSHFSNARDNEYKNRFDNQRIEHMIEQCIKMGINTIESSANERIWNILCKMREKTDETIRFIGSTRIDNTSEMKGHNKKLSFLIQNRADVCIIHSQFVDRPRKNDTIRGLDSFVDKVHEAGLLVGISTHKVETVEICEKKKLGIDLYMFPLNLFGFVYPGYSGNETVEQRVNLVRSIQKPFILMKVLGAGRIPPDEGLMFIAENSKSTDLISIGFGTENEINESVRLIQKYF